MASKKNVDPLYKGMPKHVQNLWAEAKKLKRAQDRADYVKKNGK